MNKFYLFLRILTIFTLIPVGCNLSSRVVDTSAATDISYQELLGRSASDPKIVDFIANKNCSDVTPYILCMDTGMALLIGSSQTVEGVFLYLNKSEGLVPSEDDFTPYTGKLPYGLKFYDTMAGVEYKLNRLGIGKNGLPDSGAMPDHMHYIATYQQAGLTIIYNSPIDDDAMIHAILVTK